MHCRRPHSRHRKQAQNQDGRRHRCPQQNGTDRFVRLLRSLHFFHKIVLNNKLIGVIGIHKYPDEENHYLTYFLNKRYSGKGYGTDALKLILKKIKTKKINDKRIKKVYSQILFDNIPSQKSCEKAGFRFDKIIKRNNKKYKQYIYVMKFHKILKLDYPYLKHFLTLKQIHKKLKLLKNYKPNIQNGNTSKFSNNI